MAMGIPEKRVQEGLVEYAERLSTVYSDAFRQKDKKSEGQVFTPKRVSIFMAELFDITKDKITLLDPGAGTGVLSAAFCENLLNGKKPVSLVIDAFENDPEIIPFLKRVLRECKKDLEEKGSKVEFNVVAKDFILSNKPYLSGPGLFERSEKFYDFVISNPPYYKVGTESPYAKMMAELICGQPNIYAFFMTMAASMLADKGQMVFITPRSFCSGLYYKNFRKWLLGKVRITRIHIFESRKDIFDKDGVLQENVIIKAKKGEREGAVTITTSKDKELNVLGRIDVDYSDIVSPKNSESFIRIPTSELDVKILRIIDKWPSTLNKQGVQISTGPVVDFRAKEHLRENLTKGSVPLLWMHNMQNMRVVWPSKKNKKPTAIASTENTSPLLLPVKNYVLLKRFTSKEQKRRLDSAVLKQSEFPYESVGIENHVNYIHKPKGNLSIGEAFGIAALLNTGLIDNYFRSLNGHTQVNATEIRSLPLPDLSVIKRIGEVVSKTKELPANLDEMIGFQLGIDVEIIKHLKERYDGKNR
jgi:adenine-specific DNA-methyltransferase